MTNQYYKGKYYYNGSRKWADSFDLCIKCGTNKYIHIANGLCHKCYFTEYKKSDKYKKYTRDYEKSIRLDVLNHYSNNQPKCVCCGEDSYEFLAIDHINGGGNAERKKEHTTKIYSLLKRKGYPEGYQILCHNCNMAKGIYGYCPHTKTL